MTPVVSPFTIVIDTREQLPYGFNNIQKGSQPVFVPIEFSGLKTGDYSISGLENLIAVERKSLEDLYSTLGHDRDRFEREFQRLNELDCAAVVIEASLREIYDPHSTRPSWRSLLSPLSVLGTIASWRIKYSRVQFFFGDNRDIAQVLIYKLFECYYHTK